MDDGMQCQNVDQNDDHHDEPAPGTRPCHRLFANTLPLLTHSLPPPIQFSASPPPLGGPLLSMLCSCAAGQVPIGTAPQSQPSRVRPPPLPLAARRRPLLTAALV